MTLRPLLFLSLGSLVFFHAPGAHADDPSPDQGDASAPSPPASPPASPRDVPVGAGSEEAPREKAEAASPGAGEATPHEKGKKKQAHEKKHKKLELGGRVFVRSAWIDAEKAAGPVGQTTLQSARTKADFRDHGLRVDLELELAPKPKIKDAFAQLRLHDDGPQVDLRAGYFKMPFSAIQLDSIWTLPMADRGLVDNILVNRLQVAGRAVGATLAVELPAAWKPELDVGVFQGTDDAGNPLAASASDRFGQDGVIRFAAEPVTGLVLGAAGEARLGELIALPAVVRRGYAGELDATLDVPAGPGRVRGWLEGMLGTSWLVGGTSPGHTHARFFEARGIAAYRIGGAKRRARYAEIYALAGIVDPDAKFDNDRASELTIGLTYGAADFWRLQVEAERWRIGDNAPIGIAEYAVAPADTTTVLVELGARL